MNKKQKLVAAFAAMGAATVPAWATLPVGAPPGAIDGFDITTIGTAVAPVVSDVVTGLGVIFGLLFSVVVIRFTWKYVRSAFGR